MHRCKKSRRHQLAARARWRAAEARAQAEREAGIHDRQEPSDCRDAVELDLTSYGGARLRIEPRLGYHSCRVVDIDSGRVIACVAMKTALHDIASALPRMLAPRATR